MRRIYESFLEDHFSKNNQMLFLVGPRQVGKTTLAHHFQKNFQESRYLNWDVVKDRTMILEGQNFIEKIFPTEILREKKPLIIFDEIHKYKNWKNYLKGFFDLYKDYFHILVTGSARLDVYQAGGDSLMGRYFQLRSHPLSVREIINRESSMGGINLPIKIDDEAFRHLYKYGGFPNPFLRAEDTFFIKWQELRTKQLFYEDIQNISHIHEVAQLEVMAGLLGEQIGHLLNRTSLSKKVQVTVQTISRWIATLERFYYCFLLKPWTKNVSRSLIKAPKVYLWDWSQVSDEGARFENFIASHLLKFVNYLKDSGYGNYELYFIRDKQQKEVDFLVTKNGRPWFLVEAKLSFQQPLSQSLKYFKQQLNCPHAFQVVLNMEYVNKDCFDLFQPTIVPAKTLLAQLI